jgi:hypothetical protein
MKKTIKVPPFRFGDFTAVAYVAGRYTPPSATRKPRGFLGLYLSQDPERQFGFFTFALDGRKLAHSIVSKAGANLEFALIRGAISYEVPFKEWRLFPLGSDEQRALGMPKLRDEYAAVRTALAHVLYQARLIEYFKINEASAKFAVAQLKPMFEVRVRSVAALRRDKAERDEIMRTVFRKV